MANRMTFGFRNLNGSAVQIKLLETPTGKFPSPRTVKGVQRFAASRMNKHGRRAARIAKSPGHSPYLTGALVRSIRWRPARDGRVIGRIITGALEVRVPYGRRQEFEHKTRSRYLLRALQMVYPDFVSDLRNRRILGDILFARRRQATATGVRGGFLSGV